MHHSSICLEDPLDRSIVAMQERGKTVEECLALYPAQREVLEPLLHLAARLQGARRLQAPPELRRRLTTQARTWAVEQPRRVKPTTSERHPKSEIRNPKSWRWSSAALRRSAALRPSAAAGLVISFLLMVSLLAGAGTVYAAAGALPGDVLYPLKTALEDVRLAVSLNKTKDAELRLAFAARRLDEVTQLLEGDRPEDIGPALANYTGQVEWVLASVHEGSPLPPDVQVAVARKMAADLGHYQARLTRMLDQVPEASRPVLGLAVTTSETALNRALEVIGDVPDVAEPTPLTTPTPSPERPTATPTPPAPSTMAPRSGSGQVPTATPRPERPAWIPTPPIPVPTPSRGPLQWPTPAWPEVPGWPITPGWPTPPAWPTPSAWPEVPTAWPTPPPEWEPPPPSPFEMPTPGWLPPSLPTPPAWPPGETEPEWPAPAPGGNWFPNLP